MKIDKYNMRKVIMDFPKQFSVGLEAAKEVKIFGDFNQLIFCGMGGSALPGVILKMLKVFHGWPVAIRVHRSYGLPSWVSPRALVFTVSFSGNTEELISSYKEAKDKSLSIVGITTGGKLAELCQKDKTPWVKIPEVNIQPRSAAGYQIASIIKVLSHFSIFENLDKYILAASKNLKPKALEGQGKELAQRIEGKIPVIYASDKYRGLAQIWKINFNENSKSPAFWNYFPELNHNEIVGMTHTTAPFHVLILRDEKLDHPRILKRMTITARLLKEKGIGVDIIDIEGKDILTKIFSNYILANWASYYLALEYEIDPSPVKTIEEFKKRLE